LSSKPPTCATTRRSSDQRNAARAFGAIALVLAACPSRKLRGRRSSEMPARCGEQGGAEGHRILSAAARIHDKNSR